MSNANRNQPNSKSKFSITVTNEEIGVENLSENENELQDSHSSLSATYRPNFSYPEICRPKKKAKVTPREINRFVSKSFDGNIPYSRSASISSLNKSAVLPSDLREMVRKDKKLKKAKHSCAASCLII